MSLNTLEGDLNLYSVVRAKPGDLWKSVRAPEIHFVKREEGQQDDKSTASVNQEPELNPQSLESPRPKRPPILTRGFLTTAEQGANQIKVFAPGRERRTPEPAH